MKNLNINSYLKFQKKAVGYYDSLIEAAAEHCGLTRQEADILVFYFNNRDCTLLSDAVKFRGCTEEEATEIIMKLDEKGLVKNTIDNKILLTGKGGILAKSINGAQLKFFETIFKGLNDDELFILENIIEKFSHNIQSF